MSKEIVTSETGGYVSGGYYPSYYGGYYGGFGGYYGRVYSPYGYGYGGSYVPSETRTYTSETYQFGNGNLQFEIWSRVNNYKE